MEKRTKQIIIRVLSGELAKIDAAATVRKMRRATYIRTSVLSGTPPAIPSINTEALYQLQGIGTNINQLARHANTSGRIELGELNVLRHEIARLRLALIGAIK